MPTKSAKARTRAKQRQDEYEQCAEYLRKYCRGQGLKCTTARFEVLQEIIRFEDHFDPDELLQAIQKRSGQASRATLYRTLALFEEAGIIREVLHGHHHAHYEFVFGQQEHDHIIDEQTGHVIEFDSAKVNRLCQTICKEYGLEPISHRFQIHAKPMQKSGKKSSKK